MITVVSVDSKLRYPGTEHGYKTIQSSLYQFWFATLLIKYFVGVSNDALF